MPSTGEPNRATLALRELSEALGLQFETQDWGIVNADGTRLTELIDFYESHPGLDPTQQHELGGLILASANDALISDVKLDARLRAFLFRHRMAFAAHFDYWRRLADPVEFPLADWLNARG